MNRIVHSFLVALPLLAVLLGLDAGVASAQEYLDTAGRWKRLVDPAPAGSTGFARAIGCSRGSVLVSRDNGVLLFSADSGETFRDLRAERRIDSTIGVVWAIAWPDTIGEPRRVLAIASFNQPSGPALVRMITSSDGGLNWENGVRLPTLDNVHLLADRAKDAGGADQFQTYMAVHPPFIMKFLNRRSGGTLGLIATYSGLLASEDNGRSWEVRCDSIPFGMLAMADEMNGVGYSMPRAARPSRIAALVRTTDGGRSWNWVYRLPTPYHYVTGLQAFSPEVYRLLTPDMNSLSNEWNIVQSIDSGNTWWAQQYMGTGASLTMDSYWLDTTDLHLATVFGDVRHSTNGGTRWHTLHMAEDPLPLQPTYRTNLTGFDGRYIYYASNLNRIGRWRVARRVRLPSVVNSEPGSSVGRAVAIYPNPVTGNELRITSQIRGGPILVELFDPIGQAVLSRSFELSPEDDTPLTLETGGLAPGAYTLRVRSSGETSVARVLIVHR